MNPTAQRFLCSCWFYCQIVVLESSGRTRLQICHYELWMVKRKCPNCYLRRRWQLMARRRRRQGTCSQCCTHCWESMLRHSPVHHRYLKRSYSKTRWNSLDCINVAFYFTNVGRRLSKRCCLLIIPPIVFCMWVFSSEFAKMVRVKTVARTKPKVLTRRMQQDTKIILDGCALHRLRVVRLWQSPLQHVICHGILHGS